MKIAPGHKYLRIGRERRFLLRCFREGSGSSRAGFSDRSIEGTNQRLREQNEEGRPAVFKLTQQIPAADGRTQQGYITTLYLDRESHERWMQLSAKVLTKTRYSVPPFGIHVFECVWDGQALAEAEFDSAAAANALTGSGLRGA